MENVAKWHHGVPDQSLFNSVMKQLQEVINELGYKEYKSHSYKR